MRRAAAGHRGRVLRRPPHPRAATRGALRRGWRRGERPRAPPAPADAERRPGDRQRSHLPGHDGAGHDAVLPRETRPSGEAEAALAGRIGVQALQVVGDDGRPSQTWAPIIDGTLRGPEAVFALLLSYARQIGLNAADKVLFIADGAPWIWRRLQRLIAALGLSPTQVLGLIDFYHAAKQLSDAVKLRRWSATQRTRWLNRTRGLLKRARVDEVITALRELCRGRTAGKGSGFRGAAVPSKAPSVASSISASRAHPSIGYRRASTRFFSCGLSISPADGTVCSGWP